MLSDFGLAKVKQHATSTSTLAQGPQGTVAFMAPELFKRRAEYGPASDVFSFAMTLWEMAARRNPFQDAANQVIIMGWVRDGEREDVPAGTPPAYAQVITGCWAQDPAARWDLPRAIATLRAVGPSEVPTSMMTFGANLSSSWK